MPEITQQLLLVALCCAVAGAAAGAAIPKVIARLPEPAPDPLAPDPVPASDPPPYPVPASDSSPTPDSDATAPPSHGTNTRTETTSHQRAPKIPYADLAKARGLVASCAIASALCCGLVGLFVGGSAALPAMLYLSVTGVLLAYVDWRTRLLPTAVIAPSYAILVLLLLGASAASGNWDAMVGSVLGWLVFGGTYLLLWLIHPAGMGYGDVRLSGLLGLALGWLGWAEVLVGAYAGFLVGGVVGGVLSLLKIVERRRYPFGPFMLVGALIGVMTGDLIAGWYLSSW